MARDSLDDQIFGNLPRGRRYGEREPEEADFYDRFDTAFREVWLYNQPEGPLPARHKHRGDSFWLYGKGGGNPAAAPTYPINTTAPLVTGTATVGSTLTSTTGTWSNAPTGYTYQWLRSGTPIAGATAATYVLAAADHGMSVSCNVTASNAAGSGFAASNALAIP